MQTHNQYTSAYPVLTDVQSLETHNLAVLYASSTRNRFRAFALQTNMTIRRRERLESVTTLADGETLDYGMLQTEGHESTSGVRTDPSDDILRIGDQKDETLVEWAIGVEPDDVFVGVQNPSTNTVTGLQGDRERRESGVDDLPRHGVLSQHTRTDADVPTTALSTAPNQGLLRADSDEDGRNPIRVGFANESGEQRTIDVEATGVAYHVTPVEDPSVVRDMVFGQGHNRRVLTWGSFKNDSPNIPQNWTEGEVEIDGDDVRSVIGETGA